MRLYNEVTNLSLINPLGPIADLSMQLTYYHFVASHSAAMRNKQLTLLQEIC